MRTLYHFTLCPFSRTTRFAMHEKKLDFTSEVWSFWQHASQINEHSPSGQLPILEELNGDIIPESMVILEYLEEAYPEMKLMGDNLADKNEVRRLHIWFHQKFGAEVSIPLVSEKAIKRHFHQSPNSGLIRQSKQNIQHHLAYIETLIDQRNWLAGDFFSLADIAAAAHLSVVDYLGDIPWDHYHTAKGWYVRIKSRPTFRTFLNERVSGVMPASHYSDLDF
jgi:glutathione S-transferase